jgi:hypothetical protein
MWSDRVFEGASIARQCRLRRRSRAAPRGEWLNCAVEAPLTPSLTRNDAPSVNYELFDA